jgi:hypothetical protein
MVPVLPPTQNVSHGYPLLASNEQRASRLTKIVEPQAVHMTTNETLRHHIVNYVGINICGSLIRIEANAHQAFVYDSAR